MSPRGSLTRFLVSREEAIAAVENRQILSLAIIAEQGYYDDGIVLRLLKMIFCEGIVASRDPLAQSAFVALFTARSQRFSSGVLNLKPAHEFLRGDFFMNYRFSQAFTSDRIVHLHRSIVFPAVFLFAVLFAVAIPFEVNNAKAAPNVSQDSAKARKIAAAESRFTKLDGVRIHYVNYGKGSDALVLIHGWTCNVDNWRDQIPDFAKRNRVIAIDLLGHGQSDKPEIAYSMDLFARVVDAVLRDAKVERAVLVGHSMGTPVARQFYRKYPEKTVAIVIVDGSLRPFADKAMMDRMIAGFRGPDYKEAMSQMFAGMAGPGLSAEARERIRASALNTPQHVVVSAMEGMADAAIWGDDRITVPVLAIMAKNPFFPPNIEEQFRAIAPSMEFQMWEGVGHFIMMEKPKELNAAVLAFLDKKKLLTK